MDILALLTQFGLPGGLISAFVILIYTGKLVPLSTVRQYLESIEMWKAAYEKERERNDKLSEGFTGITHYAETANRMIQSIPGVTDNGGDDD